MYENIRRFLDEDGRLRQIPAKQQLRREAFAYLADRFAAGRIYTEKEVNQILNEWHTFQDYFMLRRGLVDCGLLLRTRDGSQYWRPVSTAETELQPQRSE